MAQLIHHVTSHIRRAVCTHLALSDEGKTSYLRVAIAHGFCCVGFPSGFPYEISMLYVLVLYSFSFLRCPRLGREVVYY